MEYFRAAHVEKRKVEKKLFSVSNFFEALKKEEQFWYLSSTVFESFHDGVNHKLLSSPLVDYLDVNSFFVLFLEVCLFSLFFCGWQQQRKVFSFFSYTLKSEMKKRFRSGESILLQKPRKKTSNKTPFCEKFQSKS